MTTYVDASSDLDMLSQTENEDTDTGEVSTVSDTSITPSSATDNDSSVELKREKFSPTTKQYRPKLSVNVSADLTDVTDLEENSSSIEDNAQSSKVKHARNGANKETGIPNMFTMDNWYNQKCFETYWNHYNQVMSWCGKHFQVYNNLANKASRSHGVPSQVFDNHYRSSHGTVDSFPPASQTTYHPYVNTPSNLNKAPGSGRKNSKSRRKAKHRKIKVESCSEETITETETESSEVIEMEVTQDMIDFYAKTMEHRIKRDKEKKAEELQASTQPEHVNVEDIKITDTRTPTVEAPKERPGARRTAEMKLLYGKGAAMIHGMETALQMTFDRNLDVRQPKTWPNMPLRVVFG